MTASGEMAERPAGQDAASNAAAAPEGVFTPGSLRSQMRAAQAKARQERSRARANSGGNSSAPSGPNKYEVYRYPLPIKTFPLPGIYPHNPLSWAYFVYAWLKQTSFAKEPSVVHVGFWCPKTRSVHVRDETSMMALWEQGFFGKGNLSRSRPAWKAIQEAKKGSTDEFVSEIHTEQRRQMRQGMKWERARVQQERIWLERLEELLALPPPVGPRELLALPNSLPLRPLLPPSEELADSSPAKDGVAKGAEVLHLPSSVMRASAFPSLVDLDGPSNGQALMANGVSEMNGTASPSRALPNSGDGSRNSSPPGSNNGCNSDKPGPMKRRKSVRFSLKVESTTFQLSDPPSPGIAMVNGKAVNGNGGIVGDKANGILTGSPLANGHVVTDDRKEEGGNGNQDTTADTVQEHLQLMREEAFFLVFALGVLSVIDEGTKEPIPTRELFELFRRYSYVPDAVGPADLRPDDKFLIHYAFYHKAREQGWVPRAGVKFGVEWLLYHKGPEFDHAEYGVMVLPSYGDTWWAEHGKESLQPTWHEAHATVRVLAQVFKTALPVYVEIPPPPVFDAALAEGGVRAALALYEFDPVVNKRYRFSKLRKVDKTHREAVRKERQEIAEKKAGVTAEKQRRKAERRDKKLQERAAGKADEEQGKDTEDVE